MLSVTTEDAANRAEDLADELLDGAGGIRIEGVLTADEIVDARERIRGTDAQLAGQRLRVWGLLGMGEVFERMVQLPGVLAVVDALLGDRACLGSIGANRIPPGGNGQLPHIDYPHWDTYNPAAWPRRFGPGFALNTQATILLDDFTEANGATAWVPGTQTLMEHPDPETFDERSERMTGRAGDALVFNGATWHAAMPNNGQGERTGVLLQYLPKFVRPMEDLLTGLPPHVLERATPTLRRLLNLHGREAADGDLPQGCPEIPEPRREDL